MWSKFKIISNLSSFRFFVKYISVFFFIFLYSCSGLPEVLKPSKVDPDRPMKATDRARQNVEQGRGISLKGAMGGGNRSTSYQFSTSNPLWRASLATIDFMPLTTVDYSGGIIITDWYSDKSNPKESIKITVRFMSNEIQANSVKVIVHRKKCRTQENCSINEINSNIKFELQKTILAKASLLEKEAKNPKK